MIEYRHFRNCDSPGIVGLWRRQPPLHGRVQPMSAGMLETYVLSKPYFDPAGMILAIEDGEIVWAAPTSKVAPGQSVVLFENDLVVGNAIAE